MPRLGDDATTMLRRCYDLTMLRFDDDLTTTLRFDDDATTMYDDATV
jgi:hypothetical protein